MTIAWRLEHEEVVDEVEALGLLIRETEAGLIAFGVIQGVAEREAAVRALKERLSLPFKEFTLSADERDPVKLLLTVPDRERACVSFYDVENALPDAAGFLNLQRESFAELPHAVIFWVGQHGLRELATDAPDFWAWRSGVFDFRSEQFERPAAAMRATLGEGYDFQDRGDLERKISLYRGLLEEQGRQERPDEAFVARLCTKMSRAFLVLGRIKEAEDEASQALDIYRRLGDRAGEAEALDALGVAQADMGRLEEAERSLRDSMEIEEGIGDESRLAGSYHRRGIIAWARGHLDEGEEWYGKSLEISERLGLEADAAAGYHQTGIIVQERGRLEEAEEWYGKSLEISKRLGLERDAAFGYHQMGIIAQERGRLDEAEEWYGKSLEIKERLGLERNAADGYHQMGRVAHERRRLDEAEEWYHKSLEIHERLGLERNAAFGYHSLGTNAQERGRLDEAEEWYHKSLEIKERLGLERDAAAGYHQMGMIALERGRLDEAEEWYRKSLEIWERLGNQPDMVRTFAQMGLLRREQNRGREAVSCLGRALAIATEHKMMVGGQVLLDLARVAQDMGEEEFESAWREAFEGQEPPMKDLRELVEKMDPQETATPPEPSL